MKILGLIIYLIGFLGFAFAITELHLDIGGSFGGIVLTLLWFLLTLGIGSALMKSGSNSNDNK